MSGWLPCDATEWHGRPVARCVADAAVRRRAVLRGVVRSVGVCRPRPPAPLPSLAVEPFGCAFDAVIDDGTGTIALRWLGRVSIAGIEVGTTVEVEGTVSAHSHRLCILNPLYRFPNAVAS